MAYKIDENYLKKFISTARQTGMSDEDIASHVQSNFGVDLGYTPAPVKKEKSLTDHLVDLAPTAGSILGGIGGTLIGGIPGGVVGAGLGGSLGETARQAITPEDDTDLGKIATEGLWGAGSELAGLGLGKALGWGISKAGSTLLPKAAEGIATKNIGKTAVKAFSKSGGGNLGQKMIAHEVVGRTSHEVAEKAAEKLAQYETVISQSKAPISPYEIFDELMKKAEKYLGHANPDVHAKGEALQKIAEGTINQFSNKPIITPGELLAEKRIVAEVLKDTAYNEGVKKTVNTIHEDVLRGILNKAVPEAKSLGIDQRDLIKIAEIVKGAEELSAGGRNIPLVPILAAGAGGSAAGPLGMAGAVIAASAANSPRVTQALANTAMKTAPTVAKIGGKIGADTASNAFMRTLGGQMGGRTVKSLFGQNDLDTTEMPVESPTEAVSTLTGDSPAPASGGILDVMGLDEEKFLKAYMMNPQNKTLSAIYSAYTAEGKGTKSKATSSQVNQIADIKNTYNMLDEAVKTIQTNTGKFGPVRGALAKLNVYDPEGQTVNAQFDIIAQVMGKALEGGKLTDQDIMRYRKMLPSITDTPQTALGKIAKVKKMIQMKESSLEKTMSDMQGLDVVGTLPE